MNLKTYLDNLVPSKISNNKFYVKNVSDNIGNKLIINELPNSGRIIQFFGINESIYTIEGAIESDLYETFQANILRQETQYIDFFDKINIPVIIQSINPSYSISNLGLINFTITAYTSYLSTSIYVRAENQNIKEVSKKLQTTSLDKLKNFYNKGLFAISTATASIGSVLGTIDNITLSIDAIKDNIELLNNQINSIKSTINSLINAPASLGESFANLITSFANTFSTADLNIQAILSFAKSTQPIEISNTSQLQSEQTTLENLFNSFLLSNIIISYSDLLVNKNFIYDYELEKEVKNIQTLIDISKKTGDIELKNLMNTSLFVLTDYIKNKSKTVKYKRKLVVEYTTSLKLLCYEIYGDLTNIDNFNNWNYTIYNNGGFIQDKQEIIYYE